VVLAGSGLAVDLLAAVLARGGLDVTVRPEPDGTPVKAGVTTVPYTAELFYLLAARFDVPEIADLAMFGRLPAALQDTSGVKQSLGFIYHRARRATDPSENVQFSVPGEHAEWHAYLPDVTAHTRRIAEQYGARYLAADTAESGTAESGTAESMTVGHRGDRQRALVLDCSSGSSQATDQLTATALFGDVAPFEQSRPPKDDGYTSPWSEGTLTHAFRGGWVQLAAFGNHPAAGNHSCAVSISVAPPTDSVGAGNEDAAADSVLAGLCGRYPDLGLQLRGSHRKVSWRVSGAAPLDARADLALPLSGDSCAALFGQDLTVPLELVHAAAAVLLAPAALDGRQAAGASVRAIEKFANDLLASNARFAAAGRAATVDFASWNAFLRAWLLWSISSALACKKIRIDAVRSGNWASASKFDRGILWFDLAPGIEAVLNRCVTTIESVDRDSVSVPVAAQRVFDLLSNRRVIPPLYRFGNPRARRYRLNLATRLKLMAWMFTVAPKEYRGMLTADNITAVPDRDIELHGAGLGHQHSGTMEP